MIPHDFQAPLPSFLKILANGMTWEQHYPALFGMWKAAEFPWNQYISPGRAALGGTGGIHTCFHLPLGFQKESIGTFRLSASKNEVENNSSISLTGFVS